MLRTTRVLRRAGVHGGIRRYFHEDSPGSGGFLGFTGGHIPGADPRFGMDMTRAPGYELAAEETPLVGNQKLAEFAVRHARLTAGQASQAQGYLWVGSVLYPANNSLDQERGFAWECDVDEASSNKDVAKQDSAVAVNDAEGKKDEEGLQAKRRYSGGQARRIRKERERNALRKANKRIRRRTGPTRKPHNDIPDEDEGM